MFYNKLIKIYEYKNSSTDGGLYHKGTLTFVRSVNVDIQPISNESAVKDFGYMEQASSRIFAPAGILVPETIFEYKDKYYRVVKTKSWDDYDDCLAEDYEVEDEV